MHRRRTISGRKGERGVVILLVAIVLLFVVGAMAVLAIDLVSFYTARSEAQLAADGAALAGARVLANSGMTSDPTNTSLRDAAKLTAEAVARQVARQNRVGGRNPNAGDVDISFPNAATPEFGSNPHVRARVTRGDLPTFFARIWGRTQVTVTASATAEAYNPSGINALAGSGPPIAPVCVKPWLLPNADPMGTDPAVQIFNPTSGAIVNPSLVGQTWPNAINTSGLVARCPDCSGVGGIPNPQPGQYYPGAIDPADFPVPTQALPSCSAGFNSYPYQLAVAGCVQRPIACGATATINIDTNSYTANTTDRNTDTVQAASCLIHYNGAAADTDSIDPAWTTGQPFQFLAGNANPVANAVGKNVLISDSLVTVPVFDSTGVAPPSTVTVIGFLQLFLNHQGSMLPATQIPATIVNMSGCGTSATGQPVIGNGGSAVPVRLVTP